MNPIAQSLDLVKQHISECQRCDQTISRALAMLIVFSTLCCLQFQVTAAPFAEPGDEILRSDLELLSDLGVINIPITSWPMTWSAINAAIEDSSVDEASSVHVRIALSRIEQRLARERNIGRLLTDYQIALADNRRRVRVFEESPRSTGQLVGQASYMGGSVAANIRAELAINPADERNIRFDGSYVAAILGNTIISAGYQDKWWGPGWASTLGLSTAARPVPGLMIQRSVSSASNWPILRYLGPWTGQVFLGQLESDRSVESPFLFGARMAIKPWPRIELGASRTAQWGGEGRPQSLDSFLDMLLGNDNTGSGGVTVDNEPGNQLAGFDARFTLRRGLTPINGYVQIMGEDEAGGFPSTYLGQLGIAGSIAFSSLGSRLDWRVEYSDTTCQFHESSKRFNCAYRNSTYPTGYRYRDIPLGHSSDNDARQVLVSAQWLTAESHRYLLAIRSTEFNRGGSPDLTNSFTPTGFDQINLELSHERPYSYGMLAVGFGFDSNDNDAPEEGSQVRFFAKWSSNGF